MKSVIENLVRQALETVGVKEAEFIVEHPADLKMGDYSTNAAIKYGHKEEILDYLNKNKPEEIENVELAGPGFINFHLSKEFFKKSVEEIIKEGEEFGKNENMKGEKVMVEHTDPNPFKEFHIGHLMPNVIGSTIARMFEWSGAEVKQANYQGDKGLHVAKALFVPVQFAENKMRMNSDLKKEGILFDWEDLIKGKSYKMGNQDYENNSNAREKIEEINKHVYNKKNELVNYIYDVGKQASLEYFKKIYDRLGSKFDYYFFESDTAPVGKQIVEDNIGKVFEESEGAIVFKGSHTRVFINSQGIPTYEAKDLGNAQNKYNEYKYDLSVVVTGNEIKEYFCVLLEAMEKVLPDLARRTKHIPHGMLRLPSGKMSSRTGDVIPAESLINEVKVRVKDNEDVAIGAIKYMILRQSIGGDIIFDLEKSVSIEGDSGVYLQYAYARTTSLMEKAKAKDLTLEKTEEGTFDRETHEIEKLLYRFPEIIERASVDYSPNIIVTYLTELAGSFNNLYAHEQIVSDDSNSSYKIAIVEAFRTVMKNGLRVLGIPALEKM